MRARADFEVREAENVCPIPWHWVVPVWQEIAVMKTVLDEGLMASRLCRWLSLSIWGSARTFACCEEGRACVDPVLLLLVSPVGLLSSSFPIAFLGRSFGSFTAPPPTPITTFHLVSEALSPRPSLWPRKKKQEAAGRMFVHFQIKLCPDYNTAGSKRTTICRPSVS